MKFPMYSLKLWALTCPGTLHELSKLLAQTDSDLKACASTYLKSREPSMAKVSMQISVNLHLRAFRS